MPESQFTRRQFSDFSEVIATHLGIKMPPSKQAMLQGRLQRRMRELGIESFETYHGRFFGDSAYQAEELQHVLDLATTNKTEFFREAGHFEVLVRTVLPAWRRRKIGGPIRLWCAGCSTGEEPYSIAMVLLDQQAAGRFEFAIRATDVSTRVLQRAVRAIYPDAALAPVPERFRSRYFLRNRDRNAGVVRVAPEVRARVRFGHLNLLAPEYGLPEVADVIFFRNVLIYFDRETQQEVVRKICRHLRPGGDLFISHSENLQMPGLPLRVVGMSHYRHEPDMGT